VDCLIALGVSAIIGASFSTIYERNAVNAGLPLLNGDLREVLKTGDPIRLDLERGLIERLSDGACHEVEPLPEVSMRIYRRGGLLAARG
jgi:3-isopropylmalate/(R)-2-methylmalate dehydratase small subunit